MHTILTLTLFSVYFLSMKKENEVTLLILRLIPLFLFFSLSRENIKYVSSLSRKVCAVHAIREPLVWVVALVGVPLNIKNIMFGLGLAVSLSLSGFGENQTLSVCEDVFTFFFFFSDDLTFFKRTEKGRYY
jgi:hypothetical protein